MNIIDSLIARIEEYRTTNKNPCKNYATKLAAERATANVAQKAASHFDIARREDAPPARYVVFFVESWGRWVGAVDMTELMSRKNNSGGYIGICTGFYTF